MDCLLVQPYSNNTWCAVRYSAYLAQSSAGSVSSHYNGLILQRQIPNFDVVVLDVNCGCVKNREFSPVRDHISKTDQNVQVWFTFSKS